MSLCHDSSVKFYYSSIIRLTELFSELFRRSGNIKRNVEFRQSIYSIWKTSRKRIMECIKNRLYATLFAVALNVR